MTSRSEQHPVIVSPFANERVKEWPLRHFRELAEIIAREHGFPVAVVGTRAQRAAANDLVRSLSSEDVINACGVWSWADLAHAIDAAPYVVANNSGVAHLAASRGRWTLCLFAGSHAFNEWMPRGPNVVTMTMVLPCSPCGLGGERCPNGLVCMAELLPLQVFRRFDEVRRRTLAAEQVAADAAEPVPLRRPSLDIPAKPEDSFVDLSAEEGGDATQGSAPTGAAAIASAGGETHPTEKSPLFLRLDDGTALSLPCTIDAEKIRVHDAYGTGAQNRLRAGPAIAFDARVHGDVEEKVLFFGPYLDLEPGDYRIRLEGELAGHLRLRLAQRFCSESLFEGELNSFAEPIRLRLEAAAEKFEIIGTRTKGTRSMTLRAIEVKREASSAERVASAATAAPDAGGNARRDARPVAVRNDDGREPRVQEPIYAYGDDGTPLSIPFTIAANAMRVHDAFGAGAANRSRTNSTIVFRAEDHNGVDASLFFGPYLRLEPGDYSFQFRGELDGPLRVRFTRNFAAECLLETVLTSFAEPVRLKLEHTAEKLEIIGDRTDSTRSMILRSIAVEREEASSAERTAAAPPAPDAGEDSRRDARPVTIRSDEGRELSLPVVWPSTAMRVHEAFGKGEANRLRAGSSVAFDAKSHGGIEEQVLFFGPYFHLEPGHYSFRFRGALEGALELRFTKNFGAETLHEVEVASFEAPVRVTVETPADKVEIIGRRLNSTQAMTLSAIEIAVAPPAADREDGEGAKGEFEKRRVPIYARLFGS